MTDPLPRASTVRLMTGLGLALALSMALAACGSDAERAPAPEIDDAELAALAAEVTAVTADHD